jgi:L-fucono-1,5-lactonase
MARIIDAHHHLWDLADGVPDWLDTDETRTIARPFRVPDLAEVATATGVEATVLAQTVAEESETRAFLATAAGGGADNPIAAVTGWVDVTAADLGEAVAGLRAGEGGDLLRAIRYGVQDDPDPDALAQPAVVAGVGRLGELGLGFELLVRPRHLDGALACAVANQGTRFVLDHAGKPNIANGDFGDWADQITALSAQSNVTCKLSGLVTEAGSDWNVERLRPYTDHLLTSFGPSRLMFGSDWPVCLLAADYARWFDAAQALMAGLTAAELDAVFGGTAAAFYGL